MSRRLRELDMPVFTTSDVANLTGKPPKYAKVFLGYLAKNGKVEKIERGKYCLPGTSPYIIASRITRASYVALISAARLYNVTTQLPNTIYVFSLTYHRPMRIKGNYKVRFVKVSKEIFYGYGERGGAYVSDLEKIFVDDIYCHRSLLYTEELQEAQKRGLLDGKKLAKYIDAQSSKKTRERLRRYLGRFCTK